MIKSPNTCRLLRKKKKQEKMYIYHKCTVYSRSGCTIRGIVVGGVNNEWFQAIDGGLVRRNDTWYLVFTDNYWKNFSYFNNAASIKFSINVFTMKNDVCCHLLQLNETCSCTNVNVIFNIFFREYYSLFLFFYLNLYWNF